MRSISVREARRRLAELIAGAERGETVTITRRGREVARIGPVDRKRAGRLPDLAAFRASLKSAVEGTAGIEELRRGERS